MRRVLRTIAICLLSLLVVPPAIAAAKTRRRGRSLRSLWAVHPVPTVPLKAQAERSLGVEVETLAFETNRLVDRFDHVLSRGRNRLWRGVAAFAAFVWAVRRFDRLHFFFDRGLLPGFRPRRFNPIELWVYRALGKQTFFWAYGADVRMRKSTLALPAPNCCLQCPHPGRYCVCDDRDAERCQRRIGRTATATFSLGDMKRYTPGSINDLFYWPIDLSDASFEPAYPDASAQAPLVVVHAPNHRFFKGTDHLLGAIEQLRARGVAVELDLIEGLPRDQALRRYRRADVVFDQCLIGFHGYFALEAMGMGKPVLCFLRDPQRDVLAPDECPILNIRPQTIAAAIERLAGDRALVHRLGRQGRAYVERYYTVEAFAQRLAETYTRLGVCTL
ncbi:MAG: hypothetical protein DYG94_14385 [Leptolyngbya sp. PLA3]|nr:MAG: hypothetical protein EDM82_13395 [Cyanobacteria bacterium CYA]MCE7969916.1 hypothetical protein [Leptolyngbya sp. PL-A3]